MVKITNICKEIIPRIKHLKEQLQRTVYHGTFFLFCNSQILEEWLELVGLMATMDFGEDEINKKDLEQDCRPNVLYLLTLYKLSWRYEDLYGSYFAAMKNVIDPMFFQNEHESLSSSVKEIPSPHLCTQVFGDADNMKQQFAEMSCRMRKSCSGMQSVLSDICDSLLPVMDHGMEIIQKHSPSREKIVEAIGNDLREYTFYVAESFLDDMKRDLDRHYKTKLSDPYTFELWGELLSKEEEALKMAMEGKFADCYDEKYELWDEDVRRKMDENRELIRRIWWLCNRDKFIDLTYPGDQGDVIPLLDFGNLDMFYKIIVRRTLIQCEMFPELKAKFNAWMNPEGCLPEAFNGKQSECTYHLAPNMKGHVAKLIASMYDIGMFLKEDNTPASNVEDLARALGSAFGEDFRNWRQTLSAAIEQQNCLEIFDELQQKIKERKLKKCNYSALMHDQ